MEYRESLEIVLRDCHFLLGPVELRRLLPGIEGNLPPFTAIRFDDNEAPKFTWGMPVIHGRRLLWMLHQFLSREIMRCLASPSYQENLRLLTPAELRQDSYFQVLSEYLLKTLAEGSFLRLDSVLWLYLCDTVCRRLNQDEATDRLLFESNEGEYAKLRTVDPTLARMRFKEMRRYVEIRVKVLRSLFARNDFANSCMKEVFDEVPNNPLNREMISNRLIFTERPENIYNSLDLNEAFLVKGYKFTSTDFTGINGCLRMIITGMLARAKSGKQLSLDSYFLKQFVTDEVYKKAANLPSQLSDTRGRAPTREALEADERERVAHLLSIQEEPARFLLFHVCLEDKEYLKPIERKGTIPAEILKALRYRSSAVIFEGLYNEVTRDLLRWDFFHALRSRIRWLNRKGDRCFLDGRRVAYSTVPLDLDHFHQMYRRSRYGTAVFFDLVGFTARTKSLTREIEEAAFRGEKERYDLSAVSLAIQRVFAVRNNLENFGGIPQGFEGDAILDMFPRALDALRYVTAFVDNYTKNRTIRFRPFERPQENPYKDGFRVGMASGDYSIISIVGRSNDLAGEKSTDRAVGHTINRASRLNSGKKGDAYFLLDEDTGSTHEDYDPLGLFQVKITPQKELNNSGIASFEDTFEEIRKQVLAEGLPWFDPTTLRGGKVGGVVPIFQNYHFYFIFEERQFNRIYLVRKLDQAPELKGLEDEEIKIYEYLLFEVEEFHELLRRDSEIAPPQRAIEVADDEPSAEEEKDFLVDSAVPAAKLAEREESDFDWQDMVDEDVMRVQSEFGVSLREMKRGGETLRMAVRRQEQALEQWVEGKKESIDEFKADSTPPWEQEDEEAAASMLDSDSPGLYLGEFEASADDEALEAEPDEQNWDALSQPGEMLSDEAEAEEAPGAEMLAQRDASALDWTREDALEEGRESEEDEALERARFEGEAAAPEALGLGGRLEYTGGEDEIPDDEDPFQAERFRDLEDTNVVDEFLGEDAEDESLSEDFGTPFDDEETDDGVDGFAMLNLAALESFEKPPRQKVQLGPEGGERREEPLVESDTEAENAYTVETVEAEEASPEGLQTDGFEPWAELDEEDAGWPELSEPTVEVSLGGEEDSHQGELVESPADVWDEEDSKDDPAFEGAPLETASAEEASDGFISDERGPDGHLSGSLAVIQLDWSELAEVHELVEEIARDRGRGIGELESDAQESGAQKGNGEPSATAADEEERRPGAYSMVSPGLRVENIVRTRVSQNAMTTRSARADIPDLSILYQGYVYAIEEPDGSELARVVIGQAIAGRLTDVHVYRAVRARGEPWQLDSVFAEFMEEKRLSGYQKSDISWMIVEPLASNLVPLPLEHLERIYRRLHT